MKRTNGLMIGTILVVLVAALILIQSQFMGKAESEDDHHDDAPPTTDLNTPGHTPTVEELQNQIQGSGKGPTIGGGKGNNGPAPMKFN